MFCVINRTTFASWSKFFKVVTTLQRYQGDGVRG